MVSVVMISRRALMAALPASLFVANATAAAPKALIGAIRWDAWYSKRDESVYPQNNLASDTYVNRAPAHCRIENRELSCVGTQAVMDAEIMAASKSGLASWAFDWFPPSSSLRSAWTLYQSSKLKNLIKWCPIFGLGDIGSATNSQDEISEKLGAWVSLMEEPNFFYAEIAGARRPVLFLYYRQNELKTYFGTLDALRLAIDKLRKLSIAANIGNPYVVVFDPALDMELFRGSGADAMSNYISDFRTKKDATFADLDGQIQRYWGRMAATGASMIPIAQVGWDTRPRLDHPVPWTSPEDVRSGAPKYYFPLATPVEFSAHIREAISFVESHQSSCPSGIVLLYSWDECDEGGCVMPTLGDPTGKYLAAIAEALK